MKKSAQTREHILQAAEKLFSEFGFEGTSLREITHEAGVNLASVNYHFGSKKGLIQAVMERYQRVFMPALQEELEFRVARGGISTESLLSCFVRPLTALEDVRADGAEVYLKLLGFAYSEIQGHLRRFTMNRFGSVIQDVFRLFVQANPHLTAEILFWRLHFALGTVLFAQVSAKALSEIARADFSDPTPENLMMQRLLPYIAAGISAPEMSLPETSMHKSEALS